MKPTPKLRATALMLLLPLLLSAGCALPPKPPLVVAVPVPPLPPAARQPAPPEICVPTCSAGLVRLLSELQSMLTAAAPPASSASAATTR